MLLEGSTFSFAIFGRRANRGAAVGSLAHHVQGALRWFVEWFRGEGKRSLPGEPIYAHNVSILFKSGRIHFYPILYARIT